MLKELAINNFATRCFRDTADLDYIAARMSYRAGLVEQFHWQSLQTLEKYLKAILLYNRIPAKKIGHDLIKALEKSKDLPFDLELTESAIDFVKHINTFGGYRYLEISNHIRGPKLAELDRTVWELRRYCRPLDYSLKIKDGSSKSMMEIELKKIENSNHRPPQEFLIVGGLLEKIMRTKNDPARQPLVWNNLYFSKISRKKVTMPTYTKVRVSPLVLDLELLDEVESYVHIPKSVINSVRALKSAE